LIAKEKSNAANNMYMVMSARIPPRHVHQPLHTTFANPLIKGLKKSHSNGKKVTQNYKSKLV